MASFIVNKHKKFWVLMNYAMIFLQDRGTLYQITPLSLSSTLCHLKSSEILNIQFILVALIQLVGE